MGFNTFKASVRMAAETADVVNYICESFEDQSSEFQISMHLHPFKKTINLY